MRQNLEDSRALIIRGIKEAAPRNQNMNKAFDEQQGKEETPMEWLERLRRNMRQYSGTDPEIAASRTLLKVTFVMLAWPDIQKKLQKHGDWQEQGLSEVLREAQKVCGEREEEKMKVKAKVMVVAIRERKPIVESGTLRRDRKGGQHGIFSNSGLQSRARTKGQDERDV